MELKEAVARAKACVADIFSDEHISAVGLEEVELEHAKGQWRITIGFQREAAPGPLENLRGYHRIYKTVTLSDKDGAMIAVKNRDVGS